MANLLFNLILLLVTVNYVHSNIEVLSNEENELIVEIDSYELSIGQDIPDSGVEGRIVIASPEDACTKLKLPPADDELSEKLIWLVLVEMSNCFSDIKFQNIKAAGFKGVVMYNTKPNGRRFLKENIDSTEVDFPILFVNTNDGKKIKSLYTHDKGYYLRINRRPEEKFVLIDNPRLMLLIGAIVGVLALVFFASAYFYRKIKKQPEEPEQKK